MPPSTTSHPFSPATASDTTSHASEAASETVDRRPDSPEAQFVMGRVRGEQGDFDAAAQARRKAIELGLKCAGPHRHLGEILDHARGEKGRAIDPYREDLALGGRDPGGRVGKRLRLLEKE